VLSIILGPIFLANVVLTFVSFNMLPGLLASGILFVGVLSWFASVRLVVTNDRIKYRDWLRSADLPFADIGNVRIATGFALNQKGRLLPFRRLVLESSKNGNPQTIYMNLAKFSPHDVNELISLLRDVVERRQ
jgi:hypothetical protein